MNLITCEKKTESFLEKTVHSLYFTVSVLTVLKSGNRTCHSSMRWCNLFYKLWLSDFSYSPWMVLNLMGQAFSTKLAGARRMAMMNGRLWLWQMYPNTLSRAPQPLFHTWSKFRPWTMQGLPQSQLPSWDILEKTVSVWCYFVYIFPQQNTLPTYRSRPCPEVLLRLGRREAAVILLNISAFKQPAAAAAKSRQSCPTLCDPIDGSPPGFPVPGIENRFRMLKVITF